MDDMADMLIHVHPEFSEAEREKIEEAVKNCDGVLCASFDKHPQPHALKILYNPDRVSGKAILDVVREQDAEASMVGL